MSGAITHTMPDSATIVVVGSSTTFGAHDEEGLGWVARFSALLAKNHPASHYLTANCGVSGHTAIDGWHNLTTSVALHSPEYVIIALGTNDICVREGIEPETPQVSLTKCLLSFLKMMDYAKQNGLKLLLIGPQGVEQDVVRFKEHSDRLPGSTTFRYENARLKELNDHLEALCQRENVPFLRLFEDWHARTGLWTDGLHPNAKGHALWAEQTYEAFKSHYIDG